MTPKFIKKSVIQILILVGSIALFSLFPKNPQTASSNSIAQIPPFDNSPPNLLKPPKPTKIPPSPAPKPAEQPLVFAPPAQFRSQIVYKASISNSKVIALTFDDGPSPETLKILEVLQKHNAVATFFCLGRNLREYPEIAKKVVQAGNAIGNHTWHHYYHDVTEKIASNEIDYTGIHIYRSTGARSFLFRPPGGRLNNGFADYAKNKNYVVVMWSIDPKDYQQLPADTIANTVIFQAQPGAIVLLHDGGGSRHNTVKALNIIIPKLKQQGYRFVTIPQLLQLQAEQKQQTVDRQPK
ncbi:polysaccharide deacetylase family protein [Microcoleus sp. LEGE 07076]|uniref:polysaccharide deacetylase family protein n=1 Tax=Microcoleus sp. LEGE 07076 TaxID=915322 RepID=UPI001880E01A|nr:polysaccharide deacetylase family protein [Microcoleus sp. LEGE 07076]MBE9185440.1 polysaccharide deacetylase family protein [Microcoleus sp. LEGE 07076]